MGICGKLLAKPTKLHSQRRFCKDCVLQFLLVRAPHRECGVSSIASVAHKKDIPLGMSFLCVIAYNLIQYTRFFLLHYFHQACAPPYTRFSCRLNFAKYVSSRFPETKHASIIFATRKHSSLLTQSSSLPSNAAYIFL